MIPVVAAMIVPSSVTASARPPGARRMVIWRMRSRLPATPLRSSMMPMNTKQGTATSSWLLAEVCHNRSTNR